ncbi:MAG: LamG-like jellyroll fold domain-containing protein [Thermodesulfobacteriota bacterium]
MRDKIRRGAILAVAVLAAAFPGLAAAAGGDILGELGDSLAGRQEALASTVDREDNVIVTGYRMSAGEDFHTVKMAADGSSVLWRASFDRAGGDDRALAVAVDGLGDVVVAGYSFNGVNTDFQVIKYCGATRAGANACTGGDVLWQHTLNGGSNGDDYAVALAVDSLNNIYVGGYTQGPVGNDDFMVVKYHASGPAANGSPVWLRTHDNGGEDRVTALAVNNTGLALTGYSQNAAPNFDALTMKYSLAGALLWQQRYDGGFGDDRGWTVAMDDGGNVVASATSFNGASKQMYTARYAAADGALLWQRTYGGGNLSEPARVAVDRGGDVYLTGVTFTATGKNDFYTARYAAADGAVVWQTVYDSGTDNADVPADIEVDEDGDVFVTGYTHKAASGDDDFLTVKLKRDNGNLLWASLFDGPGSGNDQAVGMAVAVSIAASGNVSVAGWSDTDPTAAVDDDFYLVVYDGGLLNPPSGLTAATVSSTEIALSWTINSANEDGFFLERCAGLGCAGDPANFVQVGGLIPAGQSGYSDTGLVPHTWFTYRIKATAAAAGDSHYSATASALTTVLSYDPPSWVFIHNGPENADDHAYAVAVGSDNHPVATGSQLSPGLGSGGFDYFTVKIDRADASELWHALYNDPDDELDVATCITVDQSNDVVVSGYSSLYGGGVTNSNDIFTLKYDAAGPPAFGDAHLWSDQYNGPFGSDDRSTAIDAAADASGNVVVTGYGRNAGFNDDIYLLKYSPAGTRLWAAPPYDGGGNDYPGDVVIAPGGDIIVSGTSHNGSSYDLFLRKHAGASGAELWLRKIDHAGGDDELIDVTVDPAGDVYVTGYVTNGAGNSDVYVNKFSGATGAELWSAKIIDGAGHDFDDGVAIRYDGHNDQVVVAATLVAATGSADLAVLRYTTDGELVWERSLDRAASNDHARALGMDQEGNVCVAGNADDGGQTDILAACYNDEGILTGSTLYAGAAGGDDVAEAVAVNSFGEMFVAGATTNGAGNTDYLVIRSDPDVLLAPSELQATSRYSEVDLAWRDNSASEDGYHLWRKTGGCSSGAEWTSLDDLAANETSFTDNGLTPGDTYCYRLQAFRNSGMTSHYSGETEAATLIPAIGNCQATAVDTTTIALSWDDQTTGETGFAIERCDAAGQGCGDLQPLAALGADSESFVDEGVCQGRWYSYRITASGPGWSVSCLAANAAPVAVATPVVDTAAASSEARIDVSWPATNADADGYHVYRCDGAACDPRNQGELVGSTSGGLAGGVVHFAMEEAAWTGIAGEVVDESGSGNHGTAGNAVITTAGHTGNGGLFDGSGDFVQWGYGAGRPKDNFTMAAWVKTSATHTTRSESTSGTYGTSGERYLFYPDHMGNDGGAGVSVATNGVLVFEHGSGYLPALAAYNTPIGNDWKHIVVTYRNRQPRIYVNGVLVRTGLVSPRPSVYAPVVAGGGSYGWFSGSVDDLRIFDWGLTDKEVSALYGNSRMYYHDRTVAAGQAYTYGVTAYKDGGCAWESPTSNTMQATASLADPCPLTAAATSTTGINLAWSDRFTSETGYTLDRCLGTNCDFSTIDGSFSPAANQTSFADTTVCAATAYTYRVRAEKQTAPAWTSNSCTATVTLATLATPDPFTASRVSEQEVRLAWSDAYSDESGFEIERCTGAACTFGDPTTAVIALAANSVSYNDTGRTAGVTYRYRVRAVKGGGCGWPAPWSTPLAITPQFLPPAGLSVTVLNSNRLDLTWASVNASQTSIELDRCEGTGCDFSAATTFTLAGNATVYTDGAVCQGSVYRYRIRALGAGGPSDYSTAVAAATPTAMAPDNLMVTAVSESAVEVTFNDNTLDEEGFAVERCDGDLATCQADPENLFTPIASSPLVETPVPAPPTGQRLFLRMDETSWNGTAGEVKDSSGNNLNGMRTGSAAPVIGGVAGRAGSFPGSYSRVEIANQAALQTTGSQTIAMWIRPTSLAARSNPWNKSYAGEGTITLETDGKLNYYYGNLGYDGGTSGVHYQQFTLASAIPTNVWTHIAVVRDLGAMKLRWYKNGELVNETNAQFATAKASGNAVRIGYGYAGSYIGQLDEVELWTRPLTAAEIQGDYRRYEKLLHLHLEEETYAGLPAEVRDSSVFGYHGVAAGVTAAASGRYGNGALFAGNGSISLGDIDQLDKPTAFTVSLWFNRTDTASTPTNHAIRNVLVAQAADSWVNNLEIGSNGSALEFYLASSTGTNGTKTVEAGIQSGVWYHLALSYDGIGGAGAKLYLDGRLIGHWPEFTGPLVNSDATPLTLGMSRPAGSRWGQFAGSMDEVIVHSRALAADEIRRLAGGWTVDAGLAMDSDYTYRVKSYKDSPACAWDSSLLYSEPVQVHTPAPPAPGDFAAVAAASNRITLTWQDRTDTETAYVVERCRGAGCQTPDPAPLANLAADSEQYSDQPLCEADSYTYWINATDGNWTATSGPVTAVIAAPPLPAAIAATSPSDAEITLSWDDVMSDEDGYRVFRCTAADCSTGVVAGSTGDTVAEDFSYPIDTSLWAPFCQLATVNDASVPVTAADASGTARVAVTSGQLELATTSTGTGPAASYNYSRLPLANPAAIGNGDFDITVDFSLPDGEVAAGLGQYHVYARLQVNFPVPAGSASQDLFYVERFRDSGGPKYTGRIRLRDVDQSASLATAATSGKLRLRRAAGKLSCAFWNGSGWTTLLTHTGTLDGSAVPNLAAVTQYAQRNEAVNLRTLLDNLVVHAGSGSRYRFTDRGLDYLTTYQYRVFPYKDSCEWSDSFAGASAHTDIRPPADLALVSADSSRVSLAFTGTNTGASGYTLLRCEGGGCDPRAGTAVAAAAATATSVVDSTAQAGRTYSYVLQMVKDGDPGWPADRFSNVLADVATGPVGAPPSGLAASRVSEVRIDLGWTDASADESGFLIQRVAGGACDFSNPAAIAAFTVGAGVQQYADSDPALEGDTVYCYRVAAFKADLDPGPGDNGWQSGFSGNAAAETTVLPPDGLIVTPVNTTRVDLQWQEHTASETGFVILRCAGSGCLPDQQIGGVAANAVAYTDLSVCNGTTYAYRVRALRNGDWTGKDTAAVEVATPGAPAPVLTSSAPALDSTEISWEDAYSDETAVRVESCVDATGAGCADFSPLALLAPGVLSYTDGGHPASTGFCYRVRVEKAGPACAWQTDWSVICQKTLMQAPTLLVATPLSSRQIRLDWQDNSSDEDGFVVEERVWNGLWVELDRVGQGVLHYVTNYGIDAGQTHVYRVRAFRGKDRSAPSNEASATAPARQEGDSVCK